MYESDPELDGATKDSILAGVQGHLVDYALDVFSVDGFEFSWIQRGARVVISEEVFQ